MVCTYTFSKACLIHKFIKHGFFDRSLVPLTWIDIFTKSLTPPLNFEHVVLSPGIQIIHDITSPERAMNDKRYPSNITRICICIFVHVGSEMHC